MSAAQSLKVLPADVYRSVGTEKISLQMVQSATDLVPMTSMHQKGISTDRVCNPTEVNLRDLECSICHDVLWKPVACQMCETPFCSACINRWLQNDSKCPSGCKAYVERKCPPFIAKLLARLQLACVNQSMGCNQTCMYDAIDKHEFDCVYQLTQCPGCEKGVVKKDLATHKRMCPSMKVTCKDCKMMCKRGDFSKKHTSNICLSEQVRQLREESEEAKQKMQMLTCQLNDLLLWKSRTSHEKVITFDELPVAADETRWIPATYKGLQWNKVVYMVRSYALITYPNSGYTAAFAATGSRQLAFFNDEASITHEKISEPFDVVSLTVCSAWNSNLHLTVLGYYESEHVKTHSLTLSLGKPQTLLLQWPNIDKLVLRPTGDAVSAENQEPTSDTHCILTQLIINACS